MGAGHQQIFLVLIAVKQKVLYSVNRCRRKRRVEAVYSCLFPFVGFLQGAVVNGFFHFYGYRRKSLSGMTSYKRQELSICKASWRQGKGSTGRAGLQQFWLASYPGQKHPPPGA